MTSLGTHNLYDGAAPATPFADIIFFTEARPVRGSLVGYRIFIAQRQNDLAIAFPASMLRDAGAFYKRCHWGVPKVTPSRGTFWVTGQSSEGKVALLVEHRINAAFEPFKRGEGLFRKTMWEMHTRMTLRIIRKLKKRGYTVYAGGDLNTPVGVSGYRGVLNEVGRKYDRLGSTRPLVNARRLSRLGSDHFRLRAEVQ